ncbi:MAG: PH domain-containing protein [Clostridiales bacterium]|jgi:hypothetical protein|nr:PH domain-containing protein [Clostridiales bacterium]
MIDFDNGSFFKLSPASSKEGMSLVGPILVQGEKILETFKTIRDMVIFTNLRVISINVQGVTGKKKDFTSLPYNRIQAFSVETAGIFDLDSEMDLWFSGIGHVRFEIAGRHDVSRLNQEIAEYVLR